MLIESLLASGSRLLEGAARGSLLLLGQILLGTVENLEELIDTVAHASVQVRLGALDVVVQVVSELDNHIDGSLLGRSLEVAVEKDHANITISLETTDAAQLSRRVLLREIDGGSTTDGLLKLLQKQITSGTCRRSRSAESSTNLKENLTNDDIIGILEVDGKEDGHTILALCLKENALGTTVRDIQQLSYGVGFHALEDKIERSGKQVALDKRDRGGQLLCDSQGVRCEEK